MSTCSSCGKSVSFLNKIGSLCPECAKKAYRQSNEDTIEQLGGEDIHCYGVLKEVVIKPDAMNVTVGDIFITSNALILFMGMPRLFTGTIGAVGGFLLGGIGLGTGISLQNSENLSHAKSEAEKRRKATFGMSVADRIRNFASEVIKIDQVTSISLDQSTGTIEVLTSQKAIIVAVSNPTEDAKYLQAWLSEKPIQIEATEGSNVGLPAATKLLKEITSQNATSITEERMLIASQSQKYCNAILIALKKLKFQERLEAAKSLNRSSKCLASSLAQILSESQKKSNIGGYIVLTCMIILGVFFLIVGFNFLADPKEGWGGTLIIWAIGLIISIPSVVALILLPKEKRQEALLIEHLLEK